MGVIVYFAIAYLAYAVVTTVVRYRKLRHFQGPPFASLSELWLFWQSWRARLNWAEYAAIQKYGSVCRIGPNLLTTGDPDIIRHMAAPGSRWRRAGWYDGMRLDPRRDNIFSTRDEKLHADLKAKETGAYSGKDVTTLETDIDARITDLMHLLRTSYNGVAMDFSHIARYFTIDVLSTIAFGGRPFGFMAANMDLWDYHKTSAEFLPIFQILVHHQSARSFFQLPIIKDVVAPKHTDKGGMGPPLAFARQAVTARYEKSAAPRQDMLGHFMSKGLDAAQCEAEAFLQLIAGSDSTTTVLRSTMFLLMGSPLAYMKLKAEIDDAVHDGTVSSPIAQYAEIQNLPYLQACIYEGLRMYPPLGDLQTKVAPPEGDTIKGMFFPGGTEMAVNMESLTRNKDVFGEDFELFRPDRWVEADAKTKAGYRNNLDAIFGAGRFLCLGKHIAMMELHKAIFELIRNFDWQMVDPMRGIDMKVHGLYVQSNMNLMAYSRK